MKNIVKMLYSTYIEMSKAMDTVTGGMLCLMSGT